MLRAREVSIGSPWKEEGSSQGNSSSKRSSNLSSGGSSQVPVSELFTFKNIYWYLIIICLVTAINYFLQLVKIETMLKTTPGVKKHVYLQIGIDKARQECSNYWNSANFQRNELVLHPKNSSSRLAEVSWHFCWFVVKWLLPGVFHLLL